MCRAGPLPIWIGLRRETHLRVDARPGRIPTTWSPLCAHAQRRGGLALSGAGGLRTLYFVQKGGTPSRPVNPRGAPAMADIKSKETFTHANLDSATEEE